ncbi:MAG: class I SAM-dependent methyltransferase [Deltaproteobacteria bacterium]|nr:class I SAM-dependent methyltransferase [Deltaproteobacteria bacterium]
MNPSDNGHEIKECCPLCRQPGRYAFTGRDLMHKLPGQYIYAECIACGAVYQTPRPDPEQIVSFYPAHYDCYQPGKEKEKNFLEKGVLHSCYGYRHLPRTLPQWLAEAAGRFFYREAIPFYENGRLLDIGCGGGKYLLAMQRLGWRAEGVEFNAGAVQTCRQSGLDVFLGELHDARFADNSFSVVTARHVLEHVAEPVAFVAEIFRILAPGGLMVLKTPNSKALARKWFGSKWFPNEVPRHLILYSPENLRALSEQQGFIAKQCLTTSSPKWILNSWDYVQDNHKKPSRKRKICRLLARLYVAAATVTGRGDEISMVFAKPRS